MISKLREFFAKHLMPSGGRKDTAAVAILLFILLLRVGFSELIYLRPDLARAPDTGRYIPIAERILNHDAYAWDRSYPAELLNSVGYPLFIAGVYYFFGRAPWELGVVQLILSGLLVLILYLYLSRAIGTLPAFVAALAFSIDPLTLLSSLTILTETLFSVLLGVAMVMIAHWAVTQKNASLLVAGLLLGLACLVRPMGQLLVGLWALAILFFPYIRIGIKPASLSTRIKRMVLFVAPALILIVPWVVRNDLLWDCPTLSSVDRVTLRDWMAAKVIAEYKTIPLSEALNQVNSNDGGVCPQDSSEYIGVILTHPVIYAKLQVAGTIPVLFGTSFDRWLQLFGINYQLPDLWQPYLAGGMGSVVQVLWGEFERFPLGILLMAKLVAFQLLIYATALLGVFALRHVRSPETRWGIILIVTTTLFLLLSPGPDGNERFRVPAQPLLFYLAAYGIAFEILPRVEHLRSSLYKKPAELGESKAG